LNPTDVGNVHFSLGEPMYCIHKSQLNNISGGKIESYQLLGGSHRFKLTQGATVASTYQTSDGYQVVTDSHGWAMVENLATGIWAISDPSGRIMETNKHLRTAGGGSSGSGVFGGGTLAGNPVEDEDAEVQTG
jgi:hypothetical protein